MIYFLTDVLFDNYTKNPNQYLPMIEGRHVYGSYLYWILFNQGMTGIEQIVDDKNVTSKDVLFFHFDVSNRMKKNGYKKIQLRADRPMFPNCDLYATSHMSYVDNVKSFYLDEPLPVGIRKCKPTFPPIVYGCCGRRNTMHPTILNENFRDSMEKIGIQIQCNFSVSNIGNEHVFFYLRSNNKSLGPKHCNRIYQSWYMNIPCIHDCYGNSININFDGGLDFLRISDVTEMEQKMVLLKKDESLYWNMVSFAKGHEDYNNNHKIKNQIDNILLHI